METIKLDLIPGKKMPSLHASQYDDGRDYHIDLTENRVPYVLDGTETISLTVRKCDNTLVTMDIANTFADKSYIEFRTTEQMNACAGFNYGEITIEKNGTQISSLNFYLQVEGAPDEGGITSQSEINNLNRQIDDYLDETLPDMLDDDVPPIVERVIDETLAPVAKSGNYNDLSNKPTIPAAQVNSDWNANSGVSQILNKPNLSTVATTGDYNDLNNKPSVAVIDDTEASASKTYSSNKIIAIANTKASASDFNDFKDALSDVIVADDWSDFTFTGGYLAATTGEPTPNANFKYTEERRVIRGDIIDYYMRGYTSIATIACYNSNHEYIKNSSIYGLADEMHEGTFIVPQGVDYVRICKWASSKGNADTIKFTHTRYVTEDISILQDEIDEIRTDDLYDSFVENAKKLTQINYREFLGLAASNNVTDDGSLITIPAGSYAYYYFDAYALGITDIVIDADVISGNVSNVKIRIGSAFNTGTNYGFDYANGHLHKELDVITVSDNIVTIKFDNSAYGTTMVIKDLIIEKPDEVYSFALENIPRTLFVATTGEDKNNGDKDHPLRTINGALRKGGTNIKLFGGIYEEQIDLSLLHGGKFSLSSCDYAKRVILRNPNSLVTDTETKVTGYNKTYSAPIVGTISSDVYWIYQDGIADASTLITDAERHPIQRGLTYRLEDTRIVKCEADNLNDAITEIESSADYKWFVDNGVIYYSRPSTVNSDNPIRAGKRDKLFLNVSGKPCIEIVGIECKYMSINIGDTAGSKLIDCKATNICDTGAIIYNTALGAMLIRCEAASNRYNNIGDGFNASTSNIDDPKTRQNTCVMIDCWSHDNYDDGYSDHERAEISIHGGLFEYNGKAGVTPSYGSHCTCYNVLARNNFNGFNYVGAAEVEEGGKYGQLLCFGCIAENNTKAGGTGGGFCVSGAGNRVYLYDCKAIDNIYAFYPAEDTTIILTNCYADGNTYTSGGAGTVQIKNAALVESV